MVELCTWHRASEACRRTASDAGEEASDGIRQKQERTHRCVFDWTCMGGSSKDVAREADAKCRSWSLVAHFFRRGWTVSTTHVFEMHTLDRTGTVPVGGLLTLATRYVQ
mmetsp:Transcript_4657/g.29436  ORF Transcript_4657/g.29436 Transcript_4657/m.29436 type:complete len:109 (-) Transcript_4657:767-1093(-)